ncbi:hypothetical protein PENSPDRAFT_44728 [Peniophora sp. CONT]|nr:hypothetical protein PENSPDRAFT_44728 [Peniophora sp. CONT]
MAPSTRSKTGALPSTSRKRTADSDTESEPDTSTQPHPTTHKRAKVAHVEAEVEVSTRAARAPRRKVRGSLKALLDMPLDVLEAIFSTCDPATLVNVARTNKAFCRLLQSPGFALVWREAFACNENTPEAPEGWSLVKWAGLLFGGKDCQSCLSSTVDTVSFGILERLCEACIQACMMKLPYEAFCLGYKIYQHDFAKFIPTASVKRDGTTRRFIYVYESDLDTFLRDKATLTMKVEAYMEQTKAKFRSRHEHALCAEKWQNERLAHEAWLVEQARTARARETEKVRRDRYDEIMKRITVAGYDTKQDLIGASGTSKFKGIYYAHPLTEEEWTKLWSTIEPRLKANKAARLAAGAGARLRQRRASAAFHYEWYKNEVEPSAHKQCLWPSEEQTLQLEPLASFVEREADVKSPDNTDPVDEWVDQLEGDILVSTGEVIRRVMREIDLDLARKALLLDAGAEVDDPERILGLATSVFVVGKEETSPSNNVYVYFGREVLVAARDHATWLKDHPFGDPFPATFSKVGSAVVRLILKMCKLKTSTTILELDAQDAHFVCTACEPVLGTPDGTLGNEVPCREVLSWRTAVEHACRVHHRARDPVKLRSLTEDELAVLLAKTHKKPSPYASPYRIKHVVPNCFRCDHCSYELSEIPRKRQTGARKGGYLTLREVLKHVREEHDITSSAAKEGVDYFYHPRLPRGLLNSTMMDFRLIV